MSIPLLAQTLAKLGEVATSLGTVLTNLAAVQTTANNIRGDISSARDNINTATNAARDNVKNHVTAAVGAISAVAIKNVQHVIGSNANWAYGADGLGGTRYLDVPISSVNTAKTFIQPLRLLYLDSPDTAFIMYRLINASTVRCTAWGRNGSAVNPGAYGFEVVESN